VGGTAIQISGSLGEKGARYLTDYFLAFLSHQVTANFRSELKFKFTKNRPNFTKFDVTPTKADHDDQLDGLDRETLTRKCN